MFRSHLQSLVILVSISFFPLACSKDKTTTPPATPTAASGFSCGLSIPNATSNVVNSGATVNLAVTVAGGKAPFAVDQVSSSFSTTTFNLPRIYQNPGTTSVIINDSVTVREADGKSASCTLPVTVLPTGQSSNLSCLIAANPTLPRIAETATYTIDATGGTAPYVFDQLSLGTGATITSSLTQTTPSQSRVQATYNSDGIKTVSIRIRDVNSNIVTCSRIFNILPTPSLTLSANPSTSVASDSAITLTAISNYNSPSYIFSTSEPGVTIAPSGNTAIVRSTSNVAHNFSVTVLATDANTGSTVSRLISLAFVPTQANIACSLSFQWAWSTSWNRYYAIASTSAIPSSAGPLVVDSVNLNSSISAFYHWNTATQSNDLSKIDLLFSQSGYYNILFNAHDIYGRSTTCSANINY